jgi:hypothetical protein
MSTQEASRRPSQVPPPFGRLAKKPRSPGGVSLLDDGSARSYPYEYFRRCASPASRVQAYSALSNDFDSNGVRNEREETNAAGVLKGSVSTLVAAANVMAAETRQ